MNPAWNEALSRNYGSSAYGQYDYPTPPSLADTPERDLQLQRRRWSRDLFVAEQAAQQGLVSREDVEEIRKGNQSSWVQKALGLSAKEDHNSGSFLETLGDVLQLDNYGVVAMSRGAASGIAKGEMVLPNPLALNPIAQTYNVVNHVLGEEGRVSNTVEVPAIPEPTTAIMDFTMRHIFGKYGPNQPLALKVGFSPDAAIQSWRRKDTWQDVIHDISPDGTPAWAEAMGGFAGDILLSPSTYLTFGMKAGAKAEIGEKALKVLGLSGPKKLTISKYGTEIYRRATSKLLPILQKEAAEAGESIGGKLLNTEIARRWHSEIADYMVHHWDDLHKEYMEELSGKGAANKIVRAIAGVSAMAEKHGIAGESAQAAIRTALGKRKATQWAGYTAKDMFQETSSFWTKERGLYETGAAKKFLAQLPVIKAPVSWTLDTFDKGWRNPEEVNDWLRLDELAKQEEFDRARHSASEAFGGLSPEERSLVTEEIERRHVSSSLGEESLTAAAHRETDPRIEAAITYFRGEMDKILEDENKAGIPTLKLSDYVSRIRSPQARVVMEDLVRRMPDGYITDASSVYAHQRAIASLADAEEAFGKDTFLTDAYDILLRRKKASIDMIQDSQLIEKIIQKHGYPVAVVHASRRGMSNGIINQWIQRASVGAQGIIPFEQSYTESVGRLKELGFRKEDPEYNVALVRYLLRHNDELSAVERAKGGNPSLYLDGKMSPAGMMEKETHGFSDAATLHAVYRDGRSMPPSRTLRFLPREIVVDETRLGEIAGTRKIPNEKLFALGVDEAFEMANNPSHPKWRDLFEGGYKGKDSMTRAYGLANALNKWTIEHLDASLPAVIPDFDKKIVEAYHAFKPQTVKQKRALYERMAKISTKMKEPVSYRKLVPQVPSTLVDLAKATRRAYGIWTSDVAPTKAQMREVHLSASKVGLTDSMLREISKNLIGKERPEFSSEADMISLFLKPLEGGWKKTDVPSLLPRIAENGEVVPMRIKVSRKIEGNIWRESFDQVTGSATAEAPRRLKKSGMYDVVESIPSVPGKKSPTSKALEEHRGVVAAAEKEINDLIEEGKKTMPDEAWQKRAKEIDALEKHIVSLKKKSNFLRLSNEERVDLLDKAKDILKNDPKYQSLLEEIRVFKKSGEDELVAVGNHILKSMRNTPERKALMREVRSLGNTPERKALSRQISMLKSAVNGLRKDHPAPPESWSKNNEVIRKKTEELRGLHDKLKSLSKQVDKERRKSIATDGGIGERSKSGVKGVDFISPPSASDKLLKARKTLNEAEVKLRQNPTDANLQAHVDRLRAETENLKKELGQGPEKKIGLSEVGDIRPDSGVAEYKVYLPVGMAKALDELNAPSIDPEISENARRMILLYDQAIGYYKANFMTPFLSFWARNAFTSAASVVLKTGLSIMNPEGNFRNLRETALVMKYAMGKYSDAFIHEKGEVDKLASYVLSNGMTIGEVEHEMRISGVYRAMPSMEDWQSVGKVARGMAALSGGGAGLYAGSTVGGAVGGLVGEEETGAEVGGLLGAAFGTFLGGRGVAGMPVKGIDRATHIIQHRWLPLTRVGEKYSEIPFRVALFMQEMNRTGSIAEARKATHQYFVDYTGQSVFERRVVRRIVPFSAWTKHMMTNSVQQIIEEPENLAAMFKITHNVNEAQGADPEDMPDYMHNKLTMVGEYGGSKPGDSPYWAIGGVGFPIEDFAQVMDTHTSEDALKIVAGRMSWPLVAAGEALTGTDFQTGRSIDQPSAKQYQNAPRWMKALVGYREDTKLQEAYIDKPRVAWLLEKVPWSRFINVAKNVVRAERGGQSFDSALAARQILGVGVYKVDPTTKTVFENRRKIEAMEALIEHVKRRAIRYPQEHDSF